MFMELSSSAQVDLSVCLFHFCPLSSLSVSFPHHHPSVSFLISVLPSACYCYFPLPHFYHCPSISQSLASFPQSVWMHSPWWFALQLNRRTCCSASNWPERRRLKAPGCEHFAATSPTPSARLMQWVTSRSHAHTKKGGSLSGHRQAAKESRAVYKLCLVVVSSPSSSWERSTITVYVRCKIQGCKTKKILKMLTVPWWEPNCINVESSRCWFGILATWHVPWRGEGGVKCSVNCHAVIMMPGMTALSLHTSVWCQRKKKS